MRLINAEEAIKEIMDVYEYEYPTASGAFDHFATHMIPNILKNMPTVDAEPVRHGRWIERTEPISWCEDDVDVFYECSLCKCVEPGKSNYCPNCGAKIQEVK